MAATKSCTGRSWGRGEVDSSLSRMTVERVPGSGSGPVRPRKIQFSISHPGCVAGGERGGLLELKAIPEALREILRQKDWV
jgi:hypothetical protein